MSSAGDDRLSTRPIRVATGMAGLAAPSRRVARGPRWARTQGAVVGALVQHRQPRHPGRDPVEAGSAEPPTGRLSCGWHPRVGEGIWRSRSELAAIRAEVARARITRALGRRRVPRTGLRAVRWADPDRLPGSSRSSMRFDAMVDDRPFQDPPCRVPDGAGRDPPARSGHASSTPRGSCPVCRLSSIDPAVPR